MPVDISMYNTKAPEPFNPLDMITKYEKINSLRAGIESTKAGTANALEQNKLIQANTQHAEGENKFLQGRIALGDILKNSTNPNGTVDFNKAQYAASQDPDAALALDNLMQMGNKQNEGVQVIGPDNKPGLRSRQDINAELNPSTPPPPAFSPQQIDTMHNQLGSIQETTTNLAQKPDLSLSDVFNSTYDLVGKKILTPQQAFAEFKTLPMGPNGEDPTPDQLRQWAKDHAAKAAQNAEKLNAQYGARTPAQPEAPQGAGQIPEEQSPGFVTPSPVQAGGDIGGGASQQPAGGFVATGLAPGVEETAKGAASALNNLHNTVAGSSGRVFQLKEALHGLEGAGATGPGTETTNKIKSFLLAQEPEFLKKLGISPDEVKIADYDKANKYLTQYASGQMGSMGGGTDSKLATALSGNANTHISALAAQDVVKAAIGMERMQQAQVQAFDESGLPPSDYNKWQAKWNKETDPRVFMMDELSPEKRAKVISGLKKDERAKFASQLRMAIKNGYVTMPVSGGAQ